MVDIYLKEKERSGQVYHYYVLLFFHVKHTIGFLVQSL